MNKNITVTDVRAVPGDSAFLIDDGETAILCDSGFAFTGQRISVNIAKVLGDRKLDYIFLTHSHYDHAGASPFIKRRYPGAKVIASEYAAHIFTRPSAVAAMRKLDRSAARDSGIYGYEDLYDELKAEEAVKDGDIFRAGSFEFEAVSLPGHTKCCTGYYCKKEKLLVACETLGVYDGAETIAPACLVGVKMSVDSINRLKAFDIERILAPHKGLLGKSETEFYLDNAARAVTETAEWIYSLISSGKSDEEICALYAERFNTDIVQEGYPPEAMRTNTMIMIDLIRREFAKED